MTRELSGDDLKFLALFEKITGVFPLDFLQLGSTIVFLVEREDLGKAIGKEGAHIERLKAMLHRKVLVVGSADEPVALARSFFASIRVVDVQFIQPEKTLYVYVDERDRGLAIGKEGERIKIAKQLFQSKFGLHVEIRTRRAM